ncbi:MAG: hypothetical protein ACPG4U_09895 [Pseudomonadales bacterium]
MDADIILPPKSQILQAFQAALDKRVVLFTGLSGVGKSLYIQQFAKLAASAGRTVHLLQWDVTREAFQAPQVMAKYPEIDGVTHPMIRKAVGLWTRQGVVDWHTQYSDPKHILIGELPIIGNRLVELVQRGEDEAESLLAGSQTQFFVPVPSRAVRAHIVGCRAQSIANPSHEREASDAPPAVVDSMWQQIAELALSLGLEATADGGDYDPELYAGAYRYLLQHRHGEILHIDEVLPTQGSVYELDVIASELAASEAQVAQIFSDLEARLSEAQVTQMTDQWHVL